MARWDSAMAANRSSRTIPAPEDSSRGLQPDGFVYRCRLDQSKLTWKPAPAIPQPQPASRADSPQSRSSGARQQGNRERLSRAPIPIPPLPYLWDFIDERMSDMDRFHPVAAIEIDFKGENHQHSIDQSRNRAHTAPAPGPDLWAYVVHHLNTPPVEGFGQAEVEIREIDQQGGTGLSLVHLPRIS